MGQEYQIIAGRADAERGRQLLYRSRVGTRPGRAAGIDANFAPARAALTVIARTIRLAISNAISTVRQAVMMMRTWKSVIIHYAACSGVYVIIMI